MARIPLITTREQVNPDFRELYDFIERTRGSVGGPFMVQFHLPELLQITEKLGGYLRFQSPLPQDVIELVTIAVAREMDCPYVWGAHAPLALQYGVRPECVDAIKHRRAPEGLTEEEAPLVRFVQQLRRTNRAEEATFQTLLTRFGAANMVAITSLVGHYGMVATTINAFEIPVRPDMDQLPV